MLLVSRGSISTFRPRPQKGKKPSQAAQQTIKPKFKSRPRPPISRPSRNVHSPQTGAEETLLNVIIRAGLNFAGLAVMFLGPALLALTGQRSLQKSMHMAALPSGTAVAVDASVPDPESSWASATAATSEVEVSVRTPSYGQMVGAVDKRMIFQFAHALAQPGTQKNLMRALNLVQENSEAPSTSSSNGMVGAVDRRAIFSGLWQGQNQVQNTAAPATHDSYGMIGAVDRRAIFSRPSPQQAASKDVDVEKIQELLAPVGKSLETSIPKSPHGHMVGAVDKRSLFNSDMEKIFGKKILGRMVMGRPKIRFQEAFAGSLALPVAVESGDSRHLTSFS